MRKNLLILLLATSLSACGGSSSSNLGGQSLTGNVISTTVEVERRFVYALEEGRVHGFVIPSEDEGGHSHDHGHDHNHKLVLAQHDHDHHHHDHDDHDDHDHDGEALELVELDGSPYTISGVAPIDMVVARQGRWMFLLEATGALTRVSIDGVTGGLQAQAQTATNISSPRFLRLSEDGNAVAVVGDSLAIYTIAENGSLSSSPAFADETEDWTDLQLRHNTGIASTAHGAVGFSWSPMALLDPQEIHLPGHSRGQALYTSHGVFVVNSDDQSLSQLSQDSQHGSLTLTGTFPLPEALHEPQTLTSLHDGEHLLVGGEHSVMLFHFHDDELEEEAHVDTHDRPTILFPVADTNSVLVGHAEGEGYHLLQLGDHGLELFEGTLHQGGVSAFGFAQRLERLTRTLTL